MLFIYILIMFLTFSIILTIYLYYQLSTSINIEFKSKLISSFLSIVWFTSFYYLFSTIIPINELIHSNLLYNLIVWLNEELYKIIIPLIWFFFLKEKNLKNFLTLYLFSVLSFILFENYLYFFNFVTNWWELIFWSVFWRFFFSAATHYFFFFLMSSVLKWTYWETWKITHSIFLGFLAIWILHWFSNNLIDLWFFLHYFLFFSISSFIFIETIWEHIKSLSLTKDKLFWLIFTIIFFFILNPLNLTKTSLSNPSIKTYTNSYSIFHDYLSVLNIRTKLGESYFLLNENDRKKELIKNNIFENNYYFQKLLYQER